MKLRKKGCDECGLAPRKVSTGNPRYLQFAICVGYEMDIADEVWVAGKTHKIIMTIRKPFVQKANPL